MREMEDIILKQLGKKAQPLSIVSIQKALGLQSNSLRELRSALRELELRGEIVRLMKDRFTLPDKVGLVSGRIMMTRQGKGFINLDGEKEEIIIPSESTGTALHEDRVLIRREEKEGGRALGTVIQILERRRTQFVGTFQRGRETIYVVPDDPKMPYDIYVSEPSDVGRPAQVGDKVVVSLFEWNSPHTNPKGKVIEVLGSPDQEGVDMLSIIRQYELPLSFPERVLDEANSFGSNIVKEDLSGRIDCRDHLVVTIDPIDARDFDDAFCIESQSDDCWKLWVHIADVSHYVRSGSQLDKEARRRGNSTYLVDRVIPMLPEALSNELCSLKPEVDRLTKCVEFLIDQKGCLISSKCFSSVIHSRRRFSYEEAFDILKKAPSNPIERMIHQANGLAQMLRKHRFQKGALELDFPENKIYLDKKGRVDRVVKLENDVSHQLIEEFMLLANEVVAKRLKSHQSLHRIHEPPDPKRLSEYQEEVRANGLECGDLTKAKEVKRLMKQLDESSLGRALKIGFLKSMMRAKYSIKPVGHYGLAKKNYAHFTSPIRRYADLIVHRSLFSKGSKSNSKSKVSDSNKNSLKLISEHISLTERNSSNAEKESYMVKLFAYLARQISEEARETYLGMVMEVRNFGFFVDVASLGISGLVPLSSIDDEFFIFHSEKRQLIGQQTGRKIAAGDLLEVQANKVSKFKKQVDFRLKPKDEKRKKS